MKTKILSLLLTVLLLLAYFPSAMAAEDYELVFSDDLSKGNLYWKTSHGNAKVREGKLYGPYDIAYDFIVGNEELKWFNCSFESDITLLEPKPDGSGWWFACYFRDYYIRILTDGTVDWLKTDLSDRGSVGVYPKGIAIGKPYGVKIVGKGKYISVYIKSENGNYYDVGTFVDKYMISGYIGYRMMGFSSECDNVRISVPKNMENTFTEKVMTIEAGETRKLNFNGITGQKLVWSSSSKDTAFVDENGNVTMKKKGNVVITVSDEKGNVLDSCYLRGFTGLKSIAFPKEEFNIQVGDTIELCFNYNPRTADVKSATWSISDESILKSERGYDLYDCCTVRGLKPGTVTVTAVSNEDESLVATTTVNVTENILAEKKSAHFAYNGKNKNLTKTAFGIHYEKLMSPNEPMYDASVEEGIKDLGFMSMRGQGFKSNRYVWQKGMCYGMDYPAGFKPYTDEELFAIPNNLGLEYVFCICCARPAYEDGTIVPWEELTYSAADMTKFPKRAVVPVEEILQEIEWLRNAYKGNKIRIELGNEIYALSMQSEFPRVEDYAEYCEYVCEEVHKVYPDVEISVVAFDRPAERRIIGDPNNVLSKDNLAYTQADRTYTWNPVMATVKGNDALSPHDYITIQEVNNMTYDEFRKKVYTYFTDEYYGLISLKQQFNKPLWVTESGHIFEIRAFDSKAQEITHTPVMAAMVMTMSLNMIKADNVEFWNYHDISHPGFGLYYKPDARKPDYVYSPKYFTLKKVGDLINRYDKYYDVEIVNGDYEVHPLPYITPNAAYNVSLPDANAYGFGDEEGLKEVVFMNIHEGELEVSLDGMQLSRSWSWDSSDFEPYFCLGGKTYSIPTQDPELMPWCKEYENEPYTDTITLKPFEIVVAKVSGKATVNENSTATKLSQTNYHLFRNSLVMKLGTSTAYVDNQKTTIDENPSVMPVVKNSRTLVPLRFISESIGAEVSYDDATRQITVSNGENTIVFTVGSNLYTINGVEKTLDAAPEISDGRTLIPLRALGEALGKHIFWDDRGLIVVSDFDHMFSVGTYRDEPYEELIVEALKLFE